MGDDELRRDIVGQIRREGLRDICDGRWENLGRLGAVVPFLPLDGPGRADIIRRQLANIAQRLTDADSPAVLEQWSDAVVPALAAHWDDDLGTWHAPSPSGLPAIARACPRLPAGQRQRMFSAAGRFG